jgi:hypothetical protein
MANIVRCHAVMRAGHPGLRKTAEIRDFFRDSRLARVVPGGANLRFFLTTT